MSFVGASPSGSDEVGGCLVEIWRSSAELRRSFVEASSDLPLSLEGDLEHGFGNPKRHVLDEGVNTTKVKHMRPEVAKRAPRPPHNIPRHPK